MSAKYKSPSFLLPNELNTSANPLNTDGNPATGTGVNSLYSMDFDGSSEYIVSNDALITGNESRSISVWAKSSVSLTTNNNQVPFSLGTGSIGNKTKFAIKIRGSQRVQIDAKGYNVDFTSSYPGANWGIIDLNDGQWHHYVVTYATDDLKLYVDGAFIAGSTNYNSLITQNGVLIGAWYRNGVFADYFPGQIDEVSVFNRVLNTTEIAALYDGTGSNIRPSNLMATNLGPIAYYPLGEQAQNSGYPSATGNEWQFPNGVLQDYVMDFDGNNQYINAGVISALSNVSEYSISLWANIDTGASGTLRLFGNRESSDPFNGIGADIDLSASLYFYLNGGPSYPVVQVANISNYVTAGTWFNLICTFNSGQAYIFINGIQRGSATGSSTADTTTNPLYIGADPLNTGSYFDGKISNVAIWNTDQSTNKDNIYNNGSPQTSYTVTPQNWWKLNADSVYTPSAPNYSTALNFDGSNTEYIDTNFTGLNNASTVTISAWMNIPVFTNLYALGNLQIDNGTYKGISFNPSASIAFVYVNNNTSNVAYFSFNPSNYYSAGNWFNIVFVFDGSQSGTNRLKVYIDGNLVIGTWSGTPLNVLETSTSNFLIGNDGQQAAPYFTGQISNTAIYNTALTATQISTLFNFGTPETNISFSPQAWWKLNDQNAITDSSNNGHTGTNNGATDISSGVAVTPSWKIPNELPIPTVNYTSALEFNNPVTPNNNEYVDIGTISFLNQAGDFTISQWVNPANIVGNHHMPIQFNQSNFIYLKNNAWQYEFRGGQRQYVPTNGVPVPEEEWIHIALTVEGTVSKFYQNGDLKHTGVVGTTYSANAVRIGNHYSAGYPWYGQISNTALFDSALIDSDIDTLYNNGQPEATPSFSPLHWWKLDNTTTGIQDSVGSSNGTLVQTSAPGAQKVETNVYIGNVPVNGVSTTLPSTALQQSDLQFDSPYSNYSLSFDGTGQYINCGTSNISELQVLSLSCWFKEVDSSNTGTRAIIANKNYSSNNGVALWIFGSDLIFQIAAQSNNNSWNNSRVVIFRNYAPIGSWNHISCTYDGADAKIYINGILRNTWTPTQPYTVYYSPTYNELRIANRSDNTNAPFVGQIDETAIFNTALTEAQVLEIYNNGKPGNLDNFSGTAPISWWRLGENAYFNTETTPGPEFTVPNSIAGAPNGIGSGIVTTMLSADAPGTYANGIGDGLAVTDRVGDAPLSVANSQSYNMIPDDKVPYVPGYIGTQTTNASEMTFNGVDSFFDTGNIDLGINSTLTLWFKPGTSPVVNDYVLIGEGSQNYGYVIRRYSGTAFYVWVGGGNVNTGYVNFGGTIANNIIVGSWNFLAIQKAGDTITVYLKNTNGEFNSTATLSLWATSSMTFDRIGSRTISPPAQLFSGQIDEVAGFSETLTADQIKFDLYEATTPGKTADIENNTNLPTPVAWYRMGD
jgi:hypothetical protein